MERIELSDDLTPGLYAIRSESATVYVLAHRRRPADGGWRPSTMIRIPGLGSTVGVSDLQWCPVVRVAPPDVGDAERSWIEVGKRVRWTLGPSEPGDARRAPGRTYRQMQGRVMSIEPMSYAHLLDMAVERGVNIPGDEHGLGELLWRTESGTELLVECEPGWWPILAGLDVALAVIAADYVVQQVKEKFGGLRFYASPGRHDGSGGSSVIGSLTAGQASEFRRLIDDAEKRSLTICEICGEPGRTRGAHGWLKTVCDRHGTT